MKIWHFHLFSWSWKWWYKRRQILNYILMTTTNVLKIFAISIFASIYYIIIDNFSWSFQIQILAGKISPLHFPYRILLLSKVWTFFCGIQNIVNRIIRQRKSKCGICKGNDFAIADIGEILLDLQKSYFSNFQWTILLVLFFVQSLFLLHLCIHFAD